MILVKGGVTIAKGFVANGIKAGIKKSGKPDLALLYSEVPAVAAGAFTSNRFEASPVKVSKLHIRNKTHQAIIVNSGNANCANGKSGDKKAALMTECIAEGLWLDKREVLVASTGIIGVPLPDEVPGQVGRRGEGRQGGQDQDEAAAPARDGEAEAEGQEAQARPGPSEGGDDGGEAEGPP